MKHMIFLLAIINVTCFVTAQSDTSDRKMIAMSDTYQKAYKMGSIYYEIGSNKPFTGILYGKYANGNLLTTQEYVDGIGNGKWTQYDPNGNKECEGTYVDNRVEGPVKFYYEDGSLKSEGQYLHWKQPIGKWVYYDKQGIVVHTMTYTR
ncbi:MORN repeat variant [Formosa sp. Hel1_31_208]|uniref:toxin-antitoxin system YwqK family antitoxin n=1 Tax=Formosa sp. Hel1_31_208 TaxID=1798225 RepID=UPI00087DAF81|nr:hypothetical protein [Formosa sp. Hel1_31_208]SDS33647.1 MORN repeat variant [Formosa sp. Hel1_31_208]